MTDFRTKIHQLQRPKMLIHAARMGLADYRRERDLRRFGYISWPPEKTLPHLLDAEGHLEECRRNGEMSYSIAQHIDVLIALMGEMRLLPPRPTTPQP